MEQLEQLLSALPESCKDARLNLTSVLQGTTLSSNQTWSLALTSAYFCHNTALVRALLADGQKELSVADIEDAQSAASLMGMNTVYYRTRHLLGNPSYEQMRPNLRMNRMLKPMTSKVQFELCALACAALAGCETCLKAHEDSLRKHELSEAQIHEVFRIAATVAGAHVALGIAQV